MTTITLPALPYGYDDLAPHITRETLEYQNPITMDCQFCSTQYSFSAEEALSLFGEHLS